MNEGESLFTLILVIILCIGLAVTNYYRIAFKDKGDYLQEQNNGIRELYMDSLKDNIFLLQDKCPVSEMEPHLRGKGYDIALPKDCVMLIYYQWRLKDFLESRNGQGDCRKMIELVTGKDLQDLWTKMQEVIERTKNHTKQIHELQQKIKEKTK